MGSCTSHISHSRDKSQDIPVPMATAIAHEVNETCPGETGDTFVFLYTGQGQCDIPIDAVTHVLIDPSVKSIHSFAFLNSQRLVEVELCDGLQVIEEGAFRNCRSLRSVKCSSAVYAIGENAPSVTTSTASSKVVAIGGKCEGIISSNRIEKNAFKDCISLKCVEIPSSVEIIDEHAFSSCCALEEVLLCEGLEEIKKCAFYCCKSLTYIRTPSTLKLIDAWAFRYCNQLTTVELLEGLEIIGGYVFDHCTSLRRIKMPSTIKVIGENAFSYCHSLQEVLLCSGEEQKITARAFQHCHQLITVNLGDGVVRIGQSAFQNCFSSRNIVISTDYLSPSCFEGCHDLQRLFGSKRDMTRNTLELRFKDMTFNALRLGFNRLHGLPIHKICCDHAFRTADETISCLKDVVDPTPCLSDEVLFSIRSQLLSQDYLGMTPLHILACSTQHDLALYQYIIEKQATSLVIKDKWGCQPLFYAIWCGASDEVVQFLSESQTSAFPKLTMNWDTMIQTLCRAGAPPKVVKRLIFTQETYFPDHNVNWQNLVQELAINCYVRCAHPHAMRYFLPNWRSVMDFFGTPQTPAPYTQNLLEMETKIYTSKWKNVCEEIMEPISGWWRDDDPEASLEIFRFLVKCKIPERVAAIRMRKSWLDIRKCVLLIPPRGSFVTRQVLYQCFDVIHSKLLAYEQFKESLSLLELALWKSKIDQSMHSHSSIRNNLHTNNQHGSDVKGQYRVNCGADVVIPNVMEFLLDKENF
mmetsp:Transcript_37666/g.64239  ORF Transcript_37666/g.64239 Transcript_37666/m.64239 type:complete len:751 (-) Transcript_37666:6-2258(-)